MTWEHGIRPRGRRRLHLLSIMSQAFNIIIGLGISTPVHDREVVDGLNATEKRFVFQFMATVQLPDGQQFDTKIQCTQQHIMMVLV